MKKLFLSIAVVIAVVSCKKESASPTATQPKASLETQAMNLIEKTDPTLYAQLINQDPNSRAPKPTIKITHGIFHPLMGDWASGTCFVDPNCVCHITISWAPFVTEDTETSVLTTNYSAAFTEPNEGEIIMNDLVPYKISNLKSVSINFNQTGKSSVKCTTL